MIYCEKYNRSGHVDSVNKIQHVALKTYLMVDISIMAWLAGTSLSGVSSTLTLRIDNESSLKVVDETAPDP